MNEIDFGRFGPRVAAILAACDFAVNAAAKTLPDAPGQFRAAQAGLLATALRAALAGRDFSQFIGPLSRADINPLDVVAMASDGFEWARANRKAAA